MILLAAAHFLLKIFLSGLGSRVPYNDVSIVSIFVRYFWEFLGILGIFPFFPFFGGVFSSVFEVFVIYLILFVFFSKGAASGAVAGIALLRRFRCVPPFLPDMVSRASLLHFLFAL